LATCIDGLIWGFHGLFLHRNSTLRPAANQRFEMDVDGQLSVLEYTFKNYRLFLARTEVPPVFPNEGLGTKLAHAAEYARQNDFTVVAICPFVKEYVGSQPEYQPFVTTSVA
jgi:predicted GNAT family acetyltransferase